MGTFVSLHGRSLGFDSATKELYSQGIQISPKCVDASITVSNGSGVSTITIQLKDADGNDINYAEVVEIDLFTTAARVAFAATGGSTGLAIGTDGALLPVVAKKSFRATSEADGDIDLTFTDNTPGEEVYMALRLPTGRIVMSSLIKTTV